MDSEKRLSFPFTVRDMLAFEHGAKFQLQIVSQSTSASPVVIRGMTSEGPFSFVHIPTNNSVIATETFDLSDIPIMVSVQDKDQTLVQGDTFVTLSLLINGDPLYELCSGLVYRQKSISYPTSSNVDIRPGGGKLALKSSSDPAAGAELSLTVPAGQIWRIIGIKASFVTDGNAANRRPHFVITASNQELQQFFADQDHTASLTRRYHCQPAQGPLDGLDDDDIIVPMPENLLLIPGDTITTETVNLQVGDNWGIMRVMVEQWFNPA